MAPTIRELLSRPEPLLGPGIWDGLSACLAERAGFQMAFLSGYGLSASLLGMPDFGLITQTQLLHAAARICTRVRLPIIVDIDTGYGGPFNVEATVEGLSRAGAAGCFLEDQVFPKRCGHMENKRVIEVTEYLPKLRAALSARGTRSFFVTARTDARAVLGLDEAIRRARLYRDAGADAVFVEAPQSVEELITIRREVPDVTLVANMVEQGKTPLLPAHELYQLGYQLVAVPVSGLLSITRALEELFGALLRDGGTSAASGQMTTFSELNRLLGLETLYAREGAWLEPQNEPSKPSP